MTSPYLQALAAATVLELATLFLVAAVTVLQCCFVRRQGDEARGWVIWSRWSLGLYTFTLVILGANMLIKLIHRRFLEQDIQIFPAEEQAVTTTSGLLDAIASLGEHVFRVLLLLTFAALGRGLALARSNPGHQRGSGSGWQQMRPAAVWAGGSTLLMAVALFGLECCYWTRLHHDDEEKRTAPPQSTIGYAVTYLGLALHITWFILSLCVMALASRTLALSQAAAARGSDADTRMASRLFLLGALLFATQPLYRTVVYSIYYMGGSGVPLSAPFVGMPVTNVVFGIWPYSSALLVLYRLGRTRAGGVWSTKEQRTTGQTNAYKTPWGFQVTEHHAPETATVQTRQVGGGREVYGHDSRAHLRGDYAQFSGGGGGGAVCYDEDGYQHWPLYQK